jgi:hypothetical protein
MTVARIISLILLLDRSIMAYGTVASFEGIMLLSQEERGIIAAVWIVAFSTINSIAGQSKMSISKFRTCSVVTRQAHIGHIHCQKTGDIAVMRLMTAEAVTFRRRWVSSVALHQYFYRFMTGQTKKIDTVQQKLIL